MTREFEKDFQPDGKPYRVFADHLTDRTTFIQGPRNAGFEIHNENISTVPSQVPEAVMVTFASGAHAKRAMLALHLQDFRGMKGEKMCLSKACPQVAGQDDRSPCAPVPAHSFVVQATSEAFCERAVTDRRAEWAAVRQAKEAKVENMAAHVKEMEEARLAKQVRKAANIMMAREAKQAKDANRAQHIKKAEEAKVEEGDQGNGAME